MIASKSPLYQQVAETIREKVISGIYKYGSKLPSQKTLAEHFDVSLITVKRALYELIHENLLYSQPGKGIFVGKTIQSTVKPDKDTNTIGVMFSESMSLLFPSILSAIEVEARRQDYLVVVSHPSGDAGEEERQLHRLMDMGVEGFIIASRYHNCGLQPYMQEIYKQNIPIVFISYIDDVRVNYVGSDHQYGGYLATRHLIKLGYNRIAYATSEPNNPLNSLRYKGYREALIDYGFGLDDVEVISPSDPCGNRFEDGYKIAEQITKLRPVPKAVFAFSDLVALGIKKFYTEHDYYIPDQLALVGFDDIQAAAHAAVPLTTIRQPMQQIGHYAFLTLLHKKQGDKSVTRLEVVPQLVIRRSCGANGRFKT